MFNDRRFLLFSIMTIIALAAVSCKDKEEEESKEFLTGKPQFELPGFANPREVITMHASGVTDNDGNGVDYYWYTSYATSDRDTMKTFTLTMPNDFTTFSISCTAFKDGYYTSTTTKSISIVSASRKDGSISGHQNKEGDFLFVDPRDGNDYMCTKVGDTEWFKENLAYMATGKAIGNDATVGKIFGVFYTWEEAQKACPEGWRIASLQDWADAAALAGAENPDKFGIIPDVAGHFMADLSFNKDAMWEYWPKVKITDALGLEVIPSGYASIDNDGDGTSFQGMFEYATFWTSDTKDSDTAYYRYIFAEKPDLQIGTSSKDMFGASVRCVRDAK